MTGTEITSDGGSSETTVSAVVVGYLGDPIEIRSSIASLGEGDRPPDEIVLVDNSPDGRHQPTAAEFDAVFVHPGTNLGFSQAVNLGVEQSRGDYILLLNPDAMAGPDCLAVLAAALDANPEAAVAGAQVMLPDGRVNAGDNPIHPSGFCWSGNYLGRPEQGPPRPTLAVSGAAMLLRTERFRELGGFHPAIFMYFEDTDFCWRARIAGFRVLFCPEARVRHDYSFDQGPNKWGWLEESRLAAVLTNYERRTLLLLAPLLLAVELATALVAAKNGWLRQKLGAWRTVWRKRDEIRLARREVELSRRIPDRELLVEFTPVMDTPALDSGVMRLTRLPQRLYGRLLLALLG